MVFDNFETFNINATAHEEEDAIKELMHYVNMIAGLS
jgi:hypothetical protein